MAGVHQIRRPQDLAVQYNGGQANLCWDGGFRKARSNMFNRKQMIVDSEVLRYCSPLVPFWTGALMRSGITGTVVGSGNVEYTAPHARNQYYHTAQTRPYDSRRGAKWFERMKTAHKKDIQRAAERG